MLFGRYLHQNSFIHRLDPRLKILEILSISVILFFIPSFLGVIVIGLWLAVWAGISRISFLFFFRLLSKLWFLFVVIAFIQLFQGSGKVWIELPLSLRITQGGVFNAVLLSLRLILLVFASLLLSATTSPLRFVDGIEGILRFFRVSKEQSHEIGMVMGISIRFFPSIQLEWNTLIKAQKSRGIPLDFGPWIRRIPNLFSVLLPMLGNTLRNAETLEKAMISRSYSGSVGRSKMEPLNCTSSDYVMLIFHFGVLCAALYF
jgi:energy-coupling factor transport system permease protein